ncbi:MAG TPA: GNAT family N-acetyltransferase [archaeon]|nr:GNAT family N-acetyltransferase [archaeon]
MNFLIRQIEKKDFSRVHEIALKGWLFAYGHLPKEALKSIVNEYYSDSSLTFSFNRVESGIDFFAIAELNGKITGFCHVTEENQDGEAELLKLYLDLDYMGQGIAKQLLVSCENFLRDKSCKKYHTFCNKYNKKGVEFYIRNKFIHVENKDKEDEFKNGKVLWYFEKIL